MKNMRVSHVRQREIVQKFLASARYMEIKRAGMSKLKQ